MPILKGLETLGMFFDEITLSHKDWVKFFGGNNKYLVPQVLAHNFAHRVGKLCELSPAELQEQLREEPWKVRTIFEKHDSADIAAAVPHQLEDTLSGLPRRHQHDH